MTILLLVLLSTIQAKGPIYGPLKICLQSLIPNIDAVSPKENEGLTSQHVIEAQKGDDLFTVKTYVHKHRKHVGQNIEHDLFEALRLRRKENLSNNQSFLKQPAYYHKKCHKYSDFEVNITKYIPNLTKAELVYDNLPGHKYDYFKMNFWNEDIGFACQFYDLAKRLEDIHNVGFFHNNITIESLGYDENGTFTFNDYGKASKTFMFNGNLSTNHMTDQKLFEETKKAAHPGYVIEAYQLATIAFKLKYGRYYTDETHYFLTRGPFYPPVTCFNNILLDYSTMKYANLSESINCLKKEIMKHSPKGGCTKIHNQIKELYQEVKNQVIKEKLHQKEDLSQLLPSEFTKDNYIYHQEQNTRKYIDEIDGGILNNSKLINRYGPIQIQQSTETK